MYVCIARGRNKINNVSFLLLKLQRKVHIYTHNLQVSFLSIGHSVLSIALGPK